MIVYDVIGGVTKIKTTVSYITALKEVNTYKMLGLYIHEREVGFFTYIYHWIFR